MKDHRFIFVNGLHRSGTSLLYRILSAQDDVSGFANTKAPEDEGQHLQSVYGAAKEYGGPGKFGFDQSSFLDEKSPILTEENKALLFTQWARHWDLSKTWLAEKSPPNLVRTRFLQEAFPNSWFITIVRHPVAVSFATKKWSKTSIPSLVDHWLRCHDRFLADATKLNHSLMLRYENLVADPDAELSRLSEFLGFQVKLPDGAVLKAGVNDKYFEMWRKYKKGFWTRRLSGIAIRKYSEAVQQYGYSLDES